MEIFNVQYLLETLETPNELERQKNNIKSLILNNFETKKTKCTLVIDGEEIILTYGQLLINLFLLTIIKETGLKVNKDFIFVDDYITSGTINKYLNKILRNVNDSGMDYDDYKRAVYNFLNETNDISAEANPLAGNTIDLLDFIDAEINDPEAVKLFSEPDLSNMSFDEIERVRDIRGDAIMKYLADHNEMNISPFAVINSGLNKKQITQCLGFYGLKPDFDGSVIPFVVKHNFLHGLKTMEEYFLSAHGARLALATNYSYVRKSGYLSRKLNLLMLDHWHDDNFEDCGTKHYVTFHFDNLKEVSMYDGRHYYDFVNGKPDYEHLKTIDKFSSDLVGKTIALRSPVTCIGNEHGKHICRTCYGKALSRINKNINTGLVAVLYVCEKLTQMLLSAKHLLTTNTDKIDWGEDFYNAFIVNMDSIIFSDENKTELTIQFPSEDLYDEDMEAYMVTEFDIKFVDEKRLIHYVSPVPLYINEKMVPKKKDNETSFKVMSDNDTEIFKYIPHNNMLSKSLQNIIDLIESSDHLGVRTYDDLVKKFVDLLIENGMSDINAVHAEMICSKLLTDDTTGKQIDWKQDIINPYSINRVSKMVLKSPISTSLAFERLGEQLSNIETYMKDDDSIMDCLFD